eukprot:CAMPEP_0197186134 /NCGR_PEP_ID=MMETSP1423-20130617/13287_1 /TAXON_ID=476441 /ORGANISM="Pseudo-nitzschia heimii, Strain UNC1101" /LENGTH=529 /DNA_ID=CAMNT_0042637355 /DNA_START=10 /DNA_END=1596 /DNA_ORIENTATION=-
MSKQEFHGFAAAIRSATSSETFDLGGLPSTTISQVVRDAFSQDFDLDAEEMIRLTFVVGAGKGNRTKYDPSALKIVTKVLSAAGYVEDRGASCVAESAGCFKFQHDTGKNLKTVVVFPKITKATTNNLTKRISQSSSLLPPGSLEYKIAVSTLPLFTNMLKTKFPSWFQKRSLLQVIEETLVQSLDKFDGVLMKGGILSQDEKMFYEQCVSISEKKAFVKEALSQQVHDGKLTSLEVTFLLDQVATRIEELRVKKRTIPDALRERQAKLESIAKDPIPLSPLKHHAALGKLWKQAAPLMYINASGGKLLSPAETKKRGQLDDILHEIANLEESSRGLLEDDESYSERIRTYRRELQQRYSNINIDRGSQSKKRVLGVNASPSISKNKNAWNSTSKIQTPYFGAKGGRRTSTKTKNSKSRNSNKGDVFGAMMADYDSDEEENHESQVDTSHTSSSQSATTGETIGREIHKRKKKKNKSKTKSRGGRKYQDEDDILIETAIASNDNESGGKVKATEKQQSDIVLAVFSIFW